MRQKLYCEISAEKCNAAALGAFNAAISVGTAATTIDKAFWVRDTLVRPEEFNSQSEKDKKRMLELKREFDNLGYRDVRTEIGPAQWARTTKKGRSDLENRMLRTFRIEDELRMLKRSPQQKYSDKKDSIIKKAQTMYVQGRSMVDALSGVKALQSKRMNGTKRAYLDAENKMKAAEKALKKLGAFKP